MCSFIKLLPKEIYCEQDYYNYLKEAYNEWKKDRNGYPPQFFTGPFDADLAVISLNPHSGEARPESEVPSRYYCDICDTWEHYLEFYSNFCQERYGKNGKISNVIQGLSNFDKELHCFLSGNRSPQRADLEKWRIFHTEISPLATANYRQLQDDKLKCCMSLLCTLEAISIIKRSMIVLLNWKGCDLLNYMNRLQYIKSSHTPPQTYPIIPNRDMPMRNAKRLDYEVALPNGKELKILAVTSFALRQVGNRQNFLNTYREKTFNDEEKAILLDALGISK